MGIRQSSCIGLQHERWTQHVQETEQLQQTQQEVRTQYARETEQLQSTNQGRWTQNAQQTEQASTYDTEGTVHTIRQRTILTPYEQLITGDRVDTAGTLDIACAVDTA